METNKRSVKPLHTRTEKGVRFEVENVTKNDSLCGSYNFDATQYINELYDDKFFSAKLEVSSYNRESICYSVKGFMQVALKAFDEHYPLIIRPDDIWLLITHGFSKHLEKNAETLRKNFVQHGGKKTLVVEVDHFVLGQMQPEDWEMDVFPDFSKQIQSHIGEHIHGVIAGSFSTTTVTDKAAHEITLMASMKQFFEYKMETLCGIPYIELYGTEQDWINVRDRAKKLCSLMVPEEGEKWINFLSPVLDEFVCSYQGKVNQHFWQSMVKMIEHGDGSGAFSTISGWITILYYTLSQHHKHWQEMISSDGPEPEDFPAVISSAPVIWNYHGNFIKLHFHAGYYGIKQETNNGAFQSCIGWAVSHDPPEGKNRIIALEKDLAETQKMATPGNYTANYKIIQIQEELKKTKETEV